jgi:8-oxo-dGTP pyrophosphatase MutT (NUDIX family)
MTQDSQKPRHRSDVFGDDRSAGPVSELVPAATVVLLRDQPGLEVLMLHKVSKVAFGGMWVFPGGKIDVQDYPADGDVNRAACNAAARETLEETGMQADADDFVWFAHWTPPAITPKRFATWFFAARCRAQAVRVDGGEIQAFEWSTPARALARHAAGEIDLAPPTWITLHQLARHGTVDAALAQLRADGVRRFETKIVTRADGVRCAIWQGDAGYTTGDADAPGARHRLVLKSGGYCFENDVAGY